MRSNETKSPMGAIKVVSILVSVIMTILCLTACSTNSTVHGEGAGQPTEENPYISEVPGIDEPNQPIDPGADIDVDPTTEATTETTVPNNGSYTYVVDGVEITMNTNVETYIHQDQYGYYVDLVGLAGSLGYSYRGIHTDEIWRQVGFCLDSNPDIEVYFCDLSHNNQDFVGVRLSGPEHSADVSFMRADVDDSTITTYYISGENTAQYRVNYEQIVMFAFLLENGAYAPSSDWLEGIGFTNTSGNNYTVFK